MHSLLNQLRQYTDEELVQLCEVIDQEMISRMDHAEEIPDSARRRAVRRSQSYRHKTGSSAPPVRFSGMKAKRKRKYAA